MGGLFLLSRRSQGGPGGPGGNNPLAFGKSKAKFQMEPNTGITFDDVAGVDEAKQDFMEVCQSCPSSVETQHLSSYAEVAGRLTSTDLSGLFLQMQNLENSSLRPPQVLLCSCRTRGGAD